jgi:hypothetical protein
MRYCLGTNGRQTSPAEDPSGGVFYNETIFSMLRKTSIMNGLGSSFGPAFAPVWTAIGGVAMKVALKVCVLAMFVSLVVARAPNVAAAADTVEARLARLEKQVQELQDRAEIEQLLMTYGRDLDGRDFGAYSRLFASNGDWSGNLDGKHVTFTGPAEIKAAMEKAFARPTNSPKPAQNFHLLTNAIIDVDGDRATAVSKWTFVMVSNGKPVMMNSGRYDDTLIREDGHWKFLHRDAPSVLIP